MSETNSESIEQRFDRAVARAGLDVPRQALRDLARPALLLFETGPANETTGQSRIGGGPDLAAGASWPRDKSGFHFNFLAQIDLTSLPERYRPLPQAGSLSFYIGTDFIDWIVVHVPPGTALVRHDMPEDAEELAGRGANMVQWSGSQQRRLLTTPQDGDLQAKLDADGRIVFERGGRQAIVLASEYDISLSPQTLGVTTTLVAPESEDYYYDLEIGNASAFREAMIAVTRPDRGPQHFMFNGFGAEEIDEWSSKGRALAHAAEMGWTDLAEPADWFVLLSISSGGKAGFTFGDAGEVIYFANAKDTAKGDFSRVYACVQSS